MPPGIQPRGRLFVVLRGRQRVLALGGKALGADQGRADLCELAVAEASPFLAAPDDFCVAAPIVELPRLRTKAVAAEGPSGPEKVGVEIPTIALARGGVEGKVDRNRIAAGEPGGVLDGQRLARVGHERDRKGDLPFPPHCRVAPPLCGFGGRPELRPVPRPFRRADRENDLGGEHVALSRVIVLKAGAIVFDESAGAISSGGGDGPAFHAAYDLDAQMEHGGLRMKRGGCRGFPLAARIDLRSMHKCALRDI